MTPLSGLLNNKLGGSSCPQASLNILFFDERFVFLPNQSKVLPISTAGEQTASNGQGDELDLSNIVAPNNGYAFVYVSNASNIDVYFDNLQITHDRGHLIEENHYYPFGLKMAPICSQKFPDPTEGHLKNNNQYNDKEVDDEGGLNWIDFGFRNYDPQIGRFVQMDPLADSYEHQSMYCYASNNPVDFVDVDGLGIEIGGIFDGIKSLFSKAGELGCPSNVEGGGGSAGGSFLGEVGKYAGPAVSISIAIYDEVQFLMD